MKNCVQPNYFKYFFSFFENSIFFYTFSKPLYKSLILTIFCTLFYSCFKTELQEIDTPNDKLKIIANKSNQINVNFKTENIIFSYTAIKKGNSITESILKIYKSNTKIKIAEISYTIDYTKPAYKLIQHEEVIKLANQLRLSFKEDDLKTIVEKYMSFGKSILNDSNIDHSSNLVQSLFFHNAILNTINRSNIEKNDCNCTPYSAYFVDKSSFWCQEDYYVSPSDIIEKINAKQFKITNFDKNVYQYLLDNKHLKQISIEKINSVSLPKEKFKERVANYYNEIVNINPKSRKKDCSNCFWGICGNQLGCCGNYSGCCWLASWECFMHDVDCLKCDHWHCGPSCKPGTGNMQ